MNHRQKGGGIRSVKAQFLLFSISLFAILVVFCGILIHSASQALVEEELQYAREGQEDFQAAVADTVRQVDSAFVQLQYQQACRQLMEARSWEQVSPEIVREVNTAVASIKLSNSAIAEVAFVSDLVRWSNLYLPGKLDEILDALPQQRDPVPLGIFYPARPKGGACFVFGYNYYAGRVWVGALFISVELDSAQFPAPQVPGCYLVLTDGKGDSYAFGAQGSAAEPAPEELLAAGGDLPQPGGAIERSGPYLMQAVSLPQFNGRLLWAVNQLQIQPSLDSFYIAAVIFLLVFAGLLFCGNGVFYRSVVSPLNELSHTIAFIRENKLRKLEKPLVLNGCSELRAVGRDFSELLVSINTLTSEILQKSNALYEAEVLRQSAELDMLRSQINPHFLYNTLELIRAMAIKGDVEHVSLVTSAMGRIYRYTAKGEPFVPLSREIDIVKSYVSIQQARFGERITTLYSISVPAARVPVPKMLLQPLVENAFVHGLEPQEADGVLYIGARTEGCVLRITVRDNGRGIPPEHLAELQQRLAANHYDTSRHLGLMNINARLRLQYGDAYGLQLSGAPGDGTCVTICIPLSPGEEKEL